MNLAQQLKIGTTQIARDTPRCSHCGVAMSQNGLCSGCSWAYGSGYSTVDHDFVFDTYGSPDDWGLDAGDF